MLLVVTALVFVPGLIVGGIAGLRGPMLGAAAAPLTFTLLGITAVLAHAVRIPWSVILPLAVTVIAVAGVVLVRVILVKQSLTIVFTTPAWGSTTRRPSNTIVVVVVVLLAAALGFRTVTEIIPDPSLISQTYDNVFHLNAIRYILETGNASPLAIANLDAQAPAGFYPDLWHIVIATACQLTGASIPVAQSSLAAVTVALIWPTSVFFLATRIMGDRASTYLAALPFIGAFAQFPFHLMDFGVLYPNFLAFSVLPGTIALIIMVLGLAAERSKNFVAPLCALAATAPGLALAHPSAVLAAGAFALPILVVWLWRLAKSVTAGRLSWKHMLLGALLMAAFTTTLIILWTKARPSKDASFWPPTMQPAQAVGEALTFSALTPYIPWVLALLVALGIVVVLRHRGSFWIIACFAVAVFLYCVVAGFPAGPTRDFYTQVWYNDVHRVAALLPIFGIPLAALGLRFVGSNLRSAMSVLLRWKRTNLLEAKGARLALALAAVVVLTTTLQIPKANQSLGVILDQAKAGYQVTDVSELITNDELTLLQRLPSKIPADSLIMVNPGTGASLAFSLADRRTNLLAVNSKGTRDDQLLAKELPYLGKNPEVCTAIDRRGIDYVLDFGADEVNGMSHRFPDSATLAKTPGLKLIDQQGSNKLYQVTGCR